MLTFCPYHGFEKYMWKVSEFYLLVFKVMDMGGGDSNFLNFAEGRKLFILSLKY